MRNQKGCHCRFSFCYVSSFFVAKPPPRPPMQHLTTQCKQNTHIELTKCPTAPTDGFLRAVDHLRHGRWHRRRRCSTAGIAHTAPGAYSRTDKAPGFLGFHNLEPLNGVPGYQNHAPQNPAPIRRDSFPATRPYHQQQPDPLLCRPCDRSHNSNNRDNAITPNAPTVLPTQKKTKNKDYAA